MDRKKYFTAIIFIFLLFTLFLFISGFFKIGFISDDYNNLYDAVNSTLFQKFTGSLPFTNTLHLRPIYYLSLQFGYYLHNLLNLSFDNFLNFRIGNLLLFFLFSFLCGNIIYYFTKKYYLALLGLLSVILFPSDIHSICWTAGRVDLIYGIFYLLYIYLTISFLDKKSNLLIIFSTLSLALSLLTKETAITAFPVCLFFIYFFKGKDSIKSNYKIFIIHLSIFILYFIYKSLIHQFEVQIIQPAKFSIVFIKSFLALVIPTDFLSILYQLNHGNITVLIYFVIFISFLFLYFLYLFQLKFFKILLFTTLLFVISVIPYAGAGYVRPQLIIVPFSLIIIFLISTCIFEKEIKKIHFKKSLLISYSIVLLFWCYYSFTAIRQWVYGYDNSKMVSNNLIHTNIEFQKPTFVLCNPGRLGQTSMLDEINGAYNYWKYEKPVYTDTLIDLVLTGSVYEKSINPKLDINKVNENEFEIKSKSDGSFFYIEGYDINKNNYTYENNLVYIEFSQFNYINKPENFKVRFKNRDINCYINNETKFYKIF